MSDQQPIIVHMGNQPTDATAQCLNCGRKLKRGKCPSCKPDADPPGWRAL